MSLREEMHSLVEGIVLASEARADGPMLLQQGVQAWLGDVAGARQGMARQQRAALTQGRETLAQEVEGWLREVSEARQGMARVVRGHLSEAEAARKQDEAQLARERAQVVAQRKSDVSAQLHELDEAHNGMARQQRAALAQGREELAQEVEGWLREVSEARQGMARQQHAALTHAEAERSSHVQGWLSEVAGDRSAAQIEWRRLAALRGERAGISRARERAEKFSTARDRVFQHLASHPDGLRLTEIEREFGMSRFESNRAMKSLMDNGKAEKRGLLYFAI